MLKNKKGFIGIIILSILFIGILFYFQNNKKMNYKKVLENQNYDIVYDKLKTEKDQVPYININNNIIKNINKEIDSLYQYYLIYSPNGFHYQYNISDDILSIIITASVIQPESTHYDILYKSYNIDLNTIKPLKNEEILKKYNITEEKMKYYLSNKFLNYYNDLIKQKYFTEEECNFKCFLENKNVENILEDNNYYINHGHLELYKYFNIFTDYQEENYFNEESFHFVIT